MVRVLEETQLIMLDFKDALSMLGDGANLAGQCIGVGRDNMGPPPRQIGDANVDELMAEQEQVCPGL